ncbi:MAG: adenylyltransferase/cytidyltransferase family protein [Lachnospiraceae bacterium]|jgi:rfaE bifunctional protein nucleotidyltransferase chain/domain|nr:adenylyltransferase/cytidyltransferase family protein [Lachnospiraceae bacterium]
MSKIVLKKIFQSEIRPKLRQENKKVALCHGVFDLVHPGHIIHLEQAKQMADVLVVSITAAIYVRKGPGRPYFDDEMRMKVLEALECVDYVILSESYTADDIIESVEPDIYVKGEEYANAADDITGKIEEEQALVERHGGRLGFTTGQVFSSTKLINTAMSGLSDEVREYMENFTVRHTMREVREYAEKAGKLKVLVVGDIIIDKYTYCNVQGIMSKDMGYSARLSHSEEYLGGAVAIARHLSSFTDDVTLLSAIGKEENIRLRLFDELSDRVQLRLTYSSIIPSIVKHRYLTRNEKREEYRKIFAINNIPPNVRYEEEVYESFKEKLREKILDYDVVFLCDFGHGLIDREAMEIIQKNAKFLILNCQTNSSNRGLNIITKYTRADAFSLDQQELKLAFPEYTADEEISLKKLSAHLGGNGWLTRGSKGAYGICDQEIHECPAFTLSVKDTIGAGDAFLAVAGMFTAAGAPTEIGTFAGNIGGALGANIVGNKDAVEKVNVLKYASTLMNV